MSLRTLKVDGKEAVFNKAAFIQYFKRTAKAQKIHTGELEQQLADTIHTSKDAIHKWRGNSGGPRDIDTIQSLAEALGLSDKNLLLIFVNGGNKMSPLTDRQKASAKKIYDECLAFLDEFEYTNGFNDLWLAFKEKGSKNPESDLYDYVEELLRPLLLTLNQEYFDLKDCDIYDELCEFVCDDLRELYDGKLSSGYRYGALTGGYATTSEDFDKAMIRLNTIIDTYV